MLTQRALGELGARARRSLGRGISAADALLALLSVLTAHRPALLFDFADVSSEQHARALRELLLQLAAACPAGAGLAEVAENEIVLLKIASAEDDFVSDTFVCHVPSVLGLAEMLRGRGGKEGGAHPGSGPVFIDATRDRPIRAMRDLPADEWALWDTVVAELQAAVQSPDRFAEVRLGTQSCCGCTLYGLLLNYPCIYWIDPAAAAAGGASSSAGNSLGLVPLRLFQLKGKYFEQASGGESQECEILLSSFSVPTEVVGETRECLDRWRELRLRTPSKVLDGWIYEIYLNESDVTLPVVAL